MENRRQDNSNGAFIEISDLSYIYNRGRPGEYRALSGVNLTVKKGEFVALIGPNGSGKSTLAKHLNAILLPAEGKVFIDGLDTSDPRSTFAVRQRVGMVFQNPDNQIVSSLVEEDVAFGPENLGLPPEEVGSRVKAALDLTGLSPYRMHSPHLLSGGQKQKLAIAGVLSMGTACLVLDEPTSMLDPAGRRELMTTLARLNRHRGVTVILVTHFMEEAVLAGRILAMSNGRIVLDGRPAEVFANPGLLAELSLELPGVAEIARGLRRRGLPVPADVLTVEDMLAHIARVTGDGSSANRP